MTKTRFSFNAFTSAVITPSVFKRLARATPEFEYEGVGGGGGGGGGGAGGRKWWGGGRGRGGHGVAQLVERRARDSMTTVTRVGTPPGAQ